MFEKPVSELTLSDIQLVIGLPESERLEFKRDAYGRADDDAREFLKDIASMANAAGGFLMIGVDADAEERATSLVGISNAGEEAARMLSSCRANYEEQILGLDFGLVDVANGRQVLIWGIPRSTRAPHLITYKGLNQFWRRHGRQKARMTIEEIRDACMRVENIRQRLESFIADRHRDQLEAVGNHNGVMLLSATPLMVREEVLDTNDRRVRELMWRPPSLRQHGFGVLGGVNARPTLYGLEIQQGVQRLEVFRNGHISASIDLAHDQRPNLLNPVQVAEVPMSFLLFARTVMDYVGLQEPVVIKVTLAGIPGWRMPIGIVEQGSWNGRRNLEMPEMQFPYPLSPGFAGKHIANRLWNALGLDICPLFDDQGNFRPNAISRM